MNKRQQKAAHASGLTIGQRVRLSFSGLEHFASIPGLRYPYDEEARGTVVGFGYQPGTVRIVRDGRTEPVTFAASDWEAASTTPTPAP